MIVLVKYDNSNCNFPKNQTSSYFFFFETIARTIKITAASYFIVRGELNRTQATVSDQTTKNEVLNFIDMFIEKVLLSEGEVGFDDRPLLETSGRNLDNDDVLDA
ncbi:MAG: hypothetical protein ABH856_02165 [Patescibacteria group bacterium]